jgi:hypothetical protein
MHFSGQQILLILSISDIFTPMVVSIGVYHQNGKYWNKSWRWRFKNLPRGMEKLQVEITFRFNTIALTVIILLLMLLPQISYADSYTQLEGYWQCQEDGVPVTLEFKSRQQLFYNGKAYKYQLSPGTINVQEENGLINYFFNVDGGSLLVISPDGSVIQCRKAKKPNPADTASRSDEPAQKHYEAESPYKGWSPPYARPQGKVDEENPGPQALLYKFAGRWDYVTGNTLTNLFLKPDGTYEEAYEAGYSGQFTDQGGYQTGNWGATGTEQARGRWKVVGGLREGKLYLIDQSGRERVYNYHVHIQKGEVFWGEYFFNNRLYAVKYIYR